MRMFGYRTIINLLERLVMDVATLKETVAKQTTVVQSTVTLLGGLHQQLKDVSAQLAAQGANTAALDEVAASIAANTQTMADAVVANTDAAPNAAASTDAGVKA